MIKQETGFMKMLTVLLHNIQHWVERYRDDRGDERESEKWHSCFRHYMCLPFISSSSYLLHVCVDECKPASQRIVLHKYTQRDDTSHLCVKESKHAARMNEFYRSEKGFVACINGQTYLPSYEKQQWRLFFFGLVFGHYLLCDWLDELFGWLKLALLLCVWKGAQKHSDECPWEQ